MTLGRCSDLGSLLEMLAFSQVSGLPFDTVRRVLMHECNT